MAYSASNVSDRKESDLHITSFTLRRFRNIESLDWQPAPGLNLIWGGNGQGKTNLLDGIHLALTGRSFRARRDEECLPWNGADDPANPTLAQAVIARPDGQRRLRVVMGKGWKRAFAEEQWLARLADLWGEANTVTFAPDEAGLLKDSPSARRRFLDIVQSQISRIYLENLQRYHQALRQLNAVYKLPMDRPEREVRELARAWHPTLARTGAMLIIMRARKLNEAAPLARERFASLGGEGELKIAYDCAIDFETHDLAQPALFHHPEPIVEIFLKRLEEGFEQGRRLGLCSIGPHRDDLAARLADADLRKFGSQGQQRLAALTLKLESARWIEQAVGDPPILLLDDFGSELDPPRREAVLQSLGGSHQVIITATHPDDLRGARFDQVRRMAGGKLVEE